MHAVRPIDKLASPIGHGQRDLGRGDISIAIKKMLGVPKQHK